MYLMGLEKEFTEAISVVRQARFEIMEEVSRILYIPPNETLTYGHSTAVSPSLRLSFAI